MPATSPLAAGGPVRLQAPALYRDSIARAATYAEHARLAARDYRERAAAAREPRLAELFLDAAAVFDTAAATHERAVTRLLAASQRLEKQFARGIPAWLPAEDTDERRVHA